MREGGERVEGGKGAWHLHTWDNAVVCRRMERGWREVGGCDMYTHAAMQWSAGGWREGRGR